MSVVGLKNIDEANFIQNNMIPNKGIMAQDLSSSVIHNSNSPDPLSKSMIQPNTQFTFKRTLQ